MAFIYLLSMEILKMNQLNYTEKKDKSFLIKSVAGFIQFDNDWDGCLKEQNSD